MSISDRIHIAEGQIGDLQRTLGVVESALETADDVVIASRKAGRRLARILVVLLLIGVTVGAVIAVKRLMERRSGADDEVTLTIVGDDDAVPSSAEDVSSRGTP